MKFNNRTAVQHSMVNADTLTGEFCEILDLNEIFGNLVTCGGEPGIVPKWQAFLPDPDTGEMTGLVGGIGGATNARTAPVNLLNHDELYGQQDALKIGYAGGRLVGSTVYGTDDQGDPLPEMPWAARFPQVSNPITNSRKFSGTGWITTAQVSASTEIGVDGAIGASLLTRSGAASASSLFQKDIVTPNAGKALVVFFEQDLLATHQVQIQLVAVGGTTVNGWIQVGVADGIVYNSFPGVQYDVQQIGDFYRVTIYITDNGTNQTWNVYAYPATQNGPLSTTFDAAHLIDAESIEHAVALVDAIIYTDVAAVIRDPDDIQLGPSNHDDTQGTYALDVILPNADVNILGAFLRYESGQLVFDDGVSQASVSCPNSVAVRVGCTWGPDGMRCLANGMWSSTLPYSGSLLDGPFDFFRSAGWPGYFRNMAAYDEQV